MKHMNNQVKIYSRLYFVLFIVSMLVLFYGHSRWRFLSLLSYYLTPISILLSLMILGGSIKKLSIKGNLLVGFFFCLVIINSYLVGDYYGKMLWLFFVLIIGAKDIDFIGIVKCHLIVEFCFCILSGFADYLGLNDKSLIFFR